MNEKSQYIYFSVTATASLLCWLEDGTATEATMIGKEGILGVSALMGMDKSFTQVLVRHPGHGYRVSIKFLGKILACGGGRRSGNLTKSISLYNQALSNQMAQAAACSQRHFWEQQFCTWLLSCFEHEHSNTLMMTQESIGLALGVRRESITETVGKLQDAGLITYRRSCIELKNKAGLEAKACECYKFFKKELILLKADLKSMANLLGLEAA